MTADRFSVSFASQLGAAMREAADRYGVPISSWLADAAAAKLRSDALRQLIDEWEREDGSVTPAELRRARLELGIPAVDDGAATQGAPPPGDHLGAVPVTQDAMVGITDPRRRSPTVDEPDRSRRGRAHRR